MNEKQIYISIFALLISFIFVNADCTHLNSTNLLSYYSFDTDANDEASGNWNGTIDGVELEDCLLNDCYDYEVENEETISYGDVDWFDDSTNAVSFSWFQELQSTPQYMMILDKFLSNTGFTIYLDNNNDWIQLGMIGTNWLQCNCNQTVGTSVWEHWVVTYDGSKACSGVKFYLNSQLMTTNIATEDNPDNDISNAAEFYTGSRQDTLWFDGKLDELSVYDMVLNQTSINDLYNSGVACNPLSVPPPADTPVLTLNNINLSTGNYTSDFGFAFDGTVAYTDDDNFNCSLYLNNTLNETMTLINISEEQIFNLTYGLEETGFNINVTCENNNATDDFTVDNVFIDSVLPQLVIESEFTNNSNYYDDVTLTLKINVTDTNLYAVNLTGKKTDDSVWLNMFFEEITGTKIELNISNSTALIGIGNNHSIEVFAWDSHTNEQLSAEPIKKNPLLIEYKNIKISSDKEIDYILNKDSINFETKEDNSFICYETNAEFKRIQDSIYPNHWVDFTNKIWIDEFDYAFTVYGNNKLCIEGIKGKLITKSIGDLNENSAVWYFHVIDRPTLNELYYPSFNTSLNNIDTSLNNIEEEITMLGVTIALVFLWLGLWVFGYYAIQTYNIWLGGTMIVLTVPIDVWFAYFFRESLNVGTGFIGIAFAFMGAWTFGVFLMIKNKRQKMVG